MDFDVALRQIYKQYGTSVFDGRKSLNILTDLQAFKSYPALRTIYTKFISIDGNNTIIQIIDGTLSKKDATKALNGFVKATGFREDMTEYLFTSLLSMVGNTPLSGAVAFPNEYDPYFKTPKSSNKNRLTKRHKFIFASIIFAFLLLFIVPQIFDAKQETPTNSVELDTPQSIPEDADISPTAISEQANEPSANEDEDEALRPNATSDVSHPTNSDNRTTYKTKKTTHPNNVATPVVTESGTQTKPNVKDDFVPSVDKSQYLSEARRYMRDPTTHYLADKYARLALQNGELEAKQIIDQLKKSGFYE